MLQRWQKRFWRRGASDRAAGSRVPDDLNRDGVKGRLGGAEGRTRLNQ